MNVHCCHRAVDLEDGQRQLRVCGYIHRDPINVGKVSLNVQASTFIRLLMEFKVMKDFHQKDFHRLGCCKDVYLKRPVFSDRFLLHNLHL